VLCAALLLRGMGNPLGGRRSFYAFQQHYAINQVTAGRVPLGAILHSEIAVVRDFGKAASVGEAWRANPRALLWHVGLNARRAPTAVAELVEPRLGLSRGARLGLAAVLLGAAVLGAAGLGRRLARGEDGDPGRHGLVVALLVLALLLVPAIPSVLLIHPRPHYLMSVILFLIAIAAAGLGGWPRMRKRWAVLERPRALLGLLAVLLAVIPNRAHGWDLGLLRGSAPVPPPVLPDQRTVAALRGLPLRVPAAVLDATGYGFLAGWAGPIVPAVARTDRFWDAVRKADIGVIVIDPVLVNDALCRDDPDFSAFVAGERTGDFIVRAVPEAPVRIAVRRDVLAEPPGG